MGAPVSLLGKARAFARDFPRDDMPPGFLWDVVDFVPSIIDANLTGRGSWKWGSNVTGHGDVQSGILASFDLEDQLLVQTAHSESLADAVVDTRVMRVDTNTLAVTDVGATNNSLQNPVQLGDTVVHTAAWNFVPDLWRKGAAAGTTVIVPGFANMHHPKFATVWKGALISGGGWGPTGNDENDVIRYSVPGADLSTTASYDPNAFDHASRRITGLQAMRSVVLLFHTSSVERLRGSVFPNTAAGEPGDLFIEGLFDRVGCKHPRSIATWNDNCIFADEHGVHMTDGAVVRNLTQLGNISYYWRMLFDGNVGVSASTFLDYYIITLRHPQSRPPVPFGVGEDAAPPPPIPDPPPPTTRPPVPVPDPAGLTYNTTLVCDLSRRQWFRISNLNAQCFFSGGAGFYGGMERVWAGIGGSARLARVGPMFYPDPTNPQADDNGTAVTPRFETPWYRLGQEGRKRVRFAYLSYDARAAVTGNGVSINYSVSPEDSNYVVAGGLPHTTHYSRHRLPINRFTYGISFYVQSTGGNILRVYGLGVEASETERSRV